MEITRAFIAAFSLEKTVSLSPYPGKKTSTYLAWKELQRQSLAASFGGNHVLPCCGTGYFVHGLHEFGAASYWQCYVAFKARFG